MKNLSLAALCLLSFGLQARLELSPQEKGAEFQHVDAGILPLELPPLNDQLMEAVKNNDVRLAQVLLDQGASVNHTRMLMPISVRKHKEPLNHGYTSTTISGEVLDASCLLVALYQENMEMVKLLMLHNASLDALVTFQGKENSVFRPKTEGYTPMPPYDSWEVHHKFIMPLRQFAFHMIEWLGLKPKKETLDFLNNPTKFFPRPFGPRDHITPMVGANVPCPK